VRKKYGWQVAGLIWRERKALLLAGWSCQPNKAWITKDQTLVPDKTLLGD